MSNIAVIYKSNYGFTETYARWIAEEISADLLETNKVNTTDLQKYKTIVYGGGLYAGGVNGISLITKNYDSLKDKALYLFTVGAADVTDTENISAIRGSIARTLAPQMLEKIKIYHLRGGLMYSKMNFVHKAMMGIMRRVLLRKPENELRSDDKGILATYGQDVSFVDRKTIANLVTDIMQGV